MKGEDHGIASIQIKVLGSGDAMGSGGRGMASFLISDYKNGFLLDCGPGAISALKRNGSDPSSIQGIFISHFHGDHFLGLPFFMLEYQFLTERREPLVIAGPPGVRDSCEAAMDISYPKLFERVRQRFGIEYKELYPGEVFKIEGMEIVAFEMRHFGHGLSYGYKIWWKGRALAYSGDTDWNENLIPLAERTDLFLCECYSFQQEVPFHMSYRELLKHRRLLGCRRLLLWHLGPEMLAHRDSVELELAEDGMVLKI